MRISWLAMYAGTVVDFQSWSPRCRNQAFTLKTPVRGSMSEMAMLHQLTLASPFQTLTSNWDACLLAETHNRSKLIGD